jgi:hypothetical protein
MMTMEIKNYRKRKINLFCLNWLPIFVFLETVTIQIKYSSSPNGEWELIYIITNTVIRFWGGGGLMSTKSSLSDMRVATLLRLTS